MSETYYFVRLVQSLDGGPWFGVTANGARVEITPIMTFAITAPEHVPPQAHSSLSTDTGEKANG
jgi:hypothetical protein